MSVYDHYIESDALRTVIFGLVKCHIYWYCLSFSRVLALEGRCKGNDVSSVRVNSVNKG